MKYPAVIAQNTLWISEAMVARAVTNTNYLRQRRAAHNANQRRGWRWTVIQGSRYYDYHRIPNRSPRHYRDALPDEPALRALAGRKEHEGQLQAHATAALKAIIEREPIAATVQKIVAHEDFLLGSLAQAEKLARRKAWLDTLARILDDGHSAIGIMRRASLWDIASEAMSDDWDVAPYTLRRHVARYRQLTDSAQRIGYFLAHHANQNARRIGAEPLVDRHTGEVMPFDNHLAVAFSLMTNKGKANKQRKLPLWKQYKDLLLANGEEPISYRTFCRYTAAPANRMNISLRRDGFKHYNNTYLPYVSAKNLRYAHSLWAADGTSAKLGYLDPATNRIKGLYAFFVFDVATKKIMGYSAGEAERPQMVIDAFAKAMPNGNNVRPMDIITDNGSAVAKNKQRLQRITPCYRTIAPGNSQANPAETIIRLFINSLRDQPNWMYSSFHAKSINSMANPDTMAATKKDYPSKQEAEVQLMLMVRRWNRSPGTDGLSPNERYAQYGHNPKCSPIDSRDHRFAFASRTRVDVSYMRGYVKVVKSGQQQLYTIPNYPQTIKHIGKATGFAADASVTVCSDGRTADIYTNTYIYIASCPRTVLASKTYAESETINRQALQLQRARKHNVHRAGESFAQDVGHTADLLPYDIQAAASHGPVKDGYNSAENEQFNQTLAPPKGRDMTAAERGEYEAF